MNEGEYGTLMFHGKPIGEIRALRFAEVERRVREASATLETLFVAELRRLVPWDARMWGVLELRACYRNRKGRSAIRRMVRYARRCGFAGLVSVEPLTVAGPYRIEPIDAAAGVVALASSPRSGAGRPSRRANRLRPLHHSEPPPGLSRREGLRALGRIRLSYARGHDLRARRRDAPARRAGDPMKRGPRPAGRDGRATRHYRPRPGSGARARIVSRCDQCGAVAGVQFDPADPIASERAMDMLSRAQAAHCRQSCEGATFSDGRPPEPATATPTHGATHGAKRGQRS